MVNKTRPTWRRPHMNRKKYECTGSNFHTRLVPSYGSAPSLCCRVCTDRRWVDVVYSFGLNFQFQSSSLSTDSPSYPFILSSLYYSPSSVLYLCTYPFVSALLCTIVPLLLYFVHLFCNPHLSCFLTFVNAYGRVLV